jgi:short-subunit dehydrogenase
MAAPLYCATKHAMVGFVKSMKDTEALTGVKVTTICPAGVMTPLFDKQKIKQFSADEARFLTPAVCAKHMLELLQEKKYPCGTVSEITLQGTRVIPEWNVSPPDGSGTGQELVQDEQLMANMLEPITAALEKDRVGPRL